MLKKSLIAAAALCLMQACSDRPANETAPGNAATSTANSSASAQSAAAVATAMLDAMGGQMALEAVQTLVMKGGGTRMHLGQNPATGAPEPQGTLSELTETVDLANGRAAFDNIVQIGAQGFSQHRTEAYTTYQGQRLGWGTTEGRPNQVTSVNGLFSWATHNTPEMLLRRNPITIALAAAALPADAELEERALDDAACWYLVTQLNGEDIGLYIDKADSRLRGFSALDTETMWGDTNSIYVYGDYRPVGNLVLPHTLEIRKDDGIYAGLVYDEMTLDDASALAVFDIPADVVAQADQVIALNGEAFAPLQWNPIAENVTHVVAFSHHSMVVEFPSFVVVVEAPYTEAQSLTLARLVEENIGKPIRYVTPTHPHYDHTGGVRALVSLGATVMVAADHEAELRRIVESAHTNPPDALATAIANGAEVGGIEVFSDSTEITDGEQSLQLFAVEGIPHVSPKVLAFVPATGVLFQSDLFFGAPGSPDADALALAIEQLGLEVQQIAGGHGGVFPYSALVAPAQ